MKLHVEDLTGITSAMCRLGYLDDAGQPTASFWEDMAMREADDLVEGYNGHVKNWRQHKSNPYRSKTPVRK